MAVKVYSADLEREYHAIADVLARCFTKSSEIKRFEWLYANNPLGQACAWLAIDEVTKSILGAAAAFPRWFYSSGDEIQAWVLGDFCVDPMHRSLGPALQLQRACLGILETNRAAFAYDFPSASMVAVYKRLGFNMSGIMLRLAKPLRVDRKVKQLIKNSVAQRVGSSVGNSLLKMAATGITPRGNFEISIQTDPCGQEFTALVKEQRDRFRICLQRSAEYLNWRYVNNPLARHEIVTARRNGRLMGYAVWAQTEEDACIVDLFGEADPEMMRRLIIEVTALARKCGVMTLSVSLNEAHPWLPLFSELGFRPRDSVPVIIIPSKSFTGKIDSELTGWYLMAGDRDS